MATPLKVEDPVVTPAVLIISDERAAESALVVFPVPLRPKNTAILLSNVGGAVHAEDSSAGANNSAL